MLLRRRRPLPPPPPPPHHHHHPRNHSRSRSGNVCCGVKSARIRTKKRVCAAVIQSRRIPLSHSSSACSRFSTVQRRRDVDFGGDGEAVDRPPHVAVRVCPPVGQSVVYPFVRRSFVAQQYRVVQLNSTQEIAVFGMLLDRSLPIFSMTFLKQHMKYFNSRCKIQLDHPVCHPGTIYQYINHSLRVHCPKAYGGVCPTKEEER